MECLGLPSLNVCHNWNHSLPPAVIQYIYAELYRFVYIFIFLYLFIFICWRSKHLFVYFELHTCFSICFVSYIERTKIKRGQIPRLACTNLTNKVILIPIDEIKHNPSQVTAVETPHPCFPPSVRLLGGFGVKRQERRQLLIKAMFKRNK